jgi:hypothetical protein
MLGLKTRTNSYRRVSSGQASSCHSEPKGWGPLRLYIFTLCTTLCTSSQRQSLQLLPITLQELACHTASCVTCTRSAGFD